MRGDYLREPGDRDGMAKGPIDTAAQSWKKRRGGWYFHRKDREQSSQGMATIEY